MKSFFRLYPILLTLLLAGNVSAQTRNDNLISAVYRQISEFLRQALGFAQRTFAIFTPTPFSSVNYYYKTNFKGTHPDSLFIHISTPEEMAKGMDNFHFNLELQFEVSTLEQVAAIDNFIPPARQVLDSFFRIVTLQHMELPSTD